MAENYCGKDCGLCGFRDALTCPGCKAGPGRPFGGDCQIAHCCRERGHDTCATCNQNGWCGQRAKRNDLPSDRLEKQKREQARREQLEKRMPLLAKCFTLIFWLLIAANIPAVMSNDYITAYLPGLYRIGLILELAVSLAVTGCYFVLSRLNIRYQKAALFLGLAVLTNFAVNLYAGSTVLSWIRILQIPGLVLSLLGKYHLCNAHSEILIPVDYALSEKWMQLWTWYKRIWIAMIVCVVVALVLPLLGILLVVLLGIGIAVISILELVYLYRMMDHFRAFVRQGQPAA